ncbi:MAG: aminoacyl--tRNA ligase-related protein [Acidobacteriota bacterium]
MEPKALYTVRRGLATLGPALVALKAALDQRFAAWADEVGAVSMLYPTLMPVAELEPLDYFRNFPHLAVAASGVRAERLEAGFGRDEIDAMEAIPGADLADARYVLPSAACYNVYVHLKDEVLEGPLYITTVATCYRNETHYDELQRLWSFTMREVVCLGSAEEVQEHLRAFKARILAFAGRLGLGLTVAAATDPFYQPGSPVAVMQKLFPQKEELQYRGELAIASVNFHRNFFGERCRIRNPAGEPVFTGCAAFGIERWLHALLDRFEGDADAALAAVERDPEA